MADRIQKVLAETGMGSRREIEGWIKEGRIRVNSRTAQLGDTITTDDKVTVDSRLIRFKRNGPEAPRVLIYNKPEGRICSRKDPEGRPNVYQAMPKIPGARWVAVGRLDINSSGLMLFTTDGELAHRLMHPSSEVHRVYSVRVLGEVSDEDIAQLKEGVELDDGMAHFDHITDGGGEGANHWYNVTLREGRQREVRRLWEHLGFKVSRLIRIQYGMMTLPRQLRANKTMELAPQEVKKLYASIKLDLPEHMVGDQKRGGRARTKKSRSRQPEPAKQIDTVSLSKPKKSKDSPYKGKSQTKPSGPTRGKR
ncbi:pseudouridine synthase [Gammaproteobacteria bacterium AH-315-C21]|nr:pseudouridine synthase [Gammaproteobacteria bacterium AH-315-C21]